ncbi:uncharacterized protein G2W53_001660 [Senna tora]|uniref:Uncharacterized protein n=1 Tax=Senna tora TaxID=362788 RepID=A0A835CLP8_9FABA|nr:uncharacterized protein G2W53_001660 [Senna tora]
MHLCFFQQKTEEPMVSVQRTEKGFVSFKEVFGNDGSGNETKGQSRGGVGGWVRSERRGYGRNGGVWEEEGGGV